MSKLHTVLICLAVAASGACNSSKEELPGKDPMQWQFQSYSCAFGCDPLLDDILKPLIGQVLNFESPKNGFDLFSECGGTISLVKTRLSNDELIQQLSQTVSPDQQFTAKNTGLKNPTLTTARAVCHDNGKTTSTFWVVSLSEDRMKVYFEGPSFLDFKAITAN